MAIDINEDKRIRLLIEFGKIADGETDVERLLRLLTRQIKVITGAKRCYIFIKDSSRLELCSKITEGRDLKYTKIHLPLDGNSFAAQVCKTGNPINAPDAYVNKKYSHEMDILTGFKTTSLLAVPLKNKHGEIIGVFQISNKNDNTRFDEKDEGILSLLANLASGNIEIALLYEEVQLANIETVYRLALTAEYRDQNDMRKHLNNISFICETIAMRLGLSRKDVNIIKYSSVLHDIGKVAVPDNILFKPGKLTAGEFEIMKRHAAYGGKILSGAKSKLLQTACSISLRHHEKFNGKGYPDGLAGKDIPLEARIVAVADVFDALRMKRCYKEPWPMAKARDFIINGKGADFDPEAVEAFEEAFGEIEKFYNGESEKVAAAD
jgi:HD-GYP domain-containing protein (c-di-GMP phosphodiesterase class II)